MGQNKARDGRPRPEQNRVKYIRLAAMPLIIAVVLIIIIVVMDRKPQKNEESPVSMETTADELLAIDESVEPDNEQYTTDFSQYELKKDEIPEVNMLISDYFQAKVDKDPERLYQLFGKAVNDDLEKRRQELENEASYISDYQNITCYTKDGLTEDSYVAYVTYEIKFRKADTLAPGLMWCYIVKGEDGNFIIRENVVGDEANFVAQANQTEDVMLLSKQINERLRQALEADSLLAGVYKQLRDGAIVQSSEPESTEAEVSLVNEAHPGSDGQEAESADALEASGQVQLVDETSGESAETSSGTSQETIQPETNQSVSEETQETSQAEVKLGE